MPFTNPAHNYAVYLEFFHLIKLRNFIIIFEICWKVFHNQYLALDFTFLLLEVMLDMIILFDYLYLKIHTSFVNKQRILWECSYSYLQEEKNSIQRKLFVEKKKLNDSQDACFKKIIFLFRLK